MNVLATKAAKPGHVPDELVLDFDLHSIPGLVDGHTSDIHALWKHIQDTYPDMFWTPRNGGHWVCTRYADMLPLTMEPEKFSSKGLFVPLGLAPFTGPPEMDAPEHLPFRKLVSRAFTPAGLNAASIRARAAAAEIVDKLRPQGRCDFVRDFAGVMPIVTFLNLLGMPESDAGFLRNLASRMVVRATMEEAYAENHLYIDELIRQRTVAPGDDFVSMLVHAQVMDRDLTPFERHSIVMLVVTGGLDTVINMTSFAMTHFARNPAIQRDLRENPRIHDGAVEEITRRFGTSNLGRIVRVDCELGGILLKEGDHILGLYQLAGLDERVNPDPMTFDPRRKGRKHLNFGSGPHTCLGARLARREIRVFLEEWIGKMPDCHMPEGYEPSMATGTINHMHGLELEWDAG